MSGLKARSYTVTVQHGHLDDFPQASASGDSSADESGVSFSADEIEKDRPGGQASTYSDYLLEVGNLYDENLIDYAVFSCEESKAGKKHLQGFVVFNEEFLQSQKPTERLPGHWLKARNLSGSRDYCAAVGIHITKPGVFKVVEFGDWIDPGWNQTLRSRLIYQMAEELKAGTRLAALYAAMPHAVLLVGPSNIENLVKNARLSDHRQEPTLLSSSTYYYIGRTFMEEELFCDDLYSDFLIESAEEE